MFHQKLSHRKLSRRQFLWATASTVALAACAAPVQPGTAPEAAGGAAPAEEPITLTMHIHAGWQEAVPGNFAHFQNKGCVTCCRFANLWREHWRPFRLSLSVAAAIKDGHTLRISWQ